jgi:hypothetical protein
MQREIAASAIISSFALVVSGKVRSVEDYRTREEFVPHCSESCRRALQWEQWAVVRLMWKELLRAWNVSRRN